MGLDRARYLEARQWSIATLVDATELEEDDIGCWVAGEAADPRVHGRICEALGVDAGFFDRSTRLRSLLTERWEALGSICPGFCEALGRLSRDDGSDMVEQVCTDLRQYGGARLVHPALTSPGIAGFANEEALDAVESFLGFALLMIVDAEHQYDINVDGPDILILRSDDATGHALARLLVDYLHAPSTGVPGLPVVEDELQRSPHSVFFEEPAAAEASEEDGGNAFLIELANRVGLEKWLLQTDSGTEASGSGVEDLFSRKELLEEMRGEIALRRYSRNHVMGIAGSNTPEVYVERIKKIYPDELRVARVDPRSEGRILHCGEPALRALVRAMFGCIREGRAPCGSVLPLDNGSGNMKDDKDGDTYIIHGNAGQLGRGHNMGRMDARQYQLAVEELSGSHIRDLLQRLTAELRDANQEELAAEADETLAKAKADTGDGFRQAAAAVFEKGFKALERADKALAFYQRLPGPVREALSRLPEFSSS